LSGSQTKASGFAEEYLLNSFNMLKVPTEIESANQRMVKRFQKIMLFLFVFGMLIPIEWKQTFGIWGEPVSWLAEMIPSIKKAAAISPISPLVQGFYGAVFLLSPLLYGVFAWRDPFAKRFKYALDRAQSKFKFFVTVYFLVIPIFTFLLYVILFLPIEAQLNVVPTRAQLIFSLMMSYRFTLVLFGTMLTLSAYSILWFITLFLIAPFFYFFKNITHHGK
jgi:hypothetical protein